MDQVAVVYVPEKIQKERLMARNQLTEEEAQQRIASQWPIEMKKNEQISFLITKELEKKRNSK